MLIVAAIFTDDEHTVVITKLKGHKVYFYRVGQHTRRRCLTRDKFTKKYHVKK